MKFEFTFNRSVNQYGKTIIESDNYASARKMIDDALKNGKTYDDFVKCWESDYTKTEENGFYASAHIEDNGESTPHYVCKQVAPQYQYPPELKDYDCYMNVVSIDGGGDFSSYTTELYDDIKRNLDESLSDYEYHNRNAKHPERTFGEILADNGIYKFKWDDYKYKFVWSGDASTKQYTIKEKAEIRKIYERIIENGYRWDNDDIADIMTVLTGKKHESTAIKGCSQGDYAEVIYCTEYTSNGEIDEISALYFNTGDEWHIEDEDCNIYIGVPFPSEEETREWLADYLGCKEDEIELIYA